MTKQFGTLTIRADELDDKEAYAYEAQILGMLHGLDVTQTGHAVLNAFRWYRREVLIYPYDGRLGKCNAAAYEDWGMFRTKVSFTPLQYPHARCEAQGWAGHSPHQIFVHELTHAVRSVAGKLLSIPSNFSTGPAGQEEEIAMLVTNIFSSETHRRLRTSYDSDTPASYYYFGSDNKENNDESDYSRMVLNWDRDLIKTFCNQHNEFSRWLARVEARFNPLRDYFDQTRPQGWRPTPSRR
jgi:hypothetical protein